MDEVAAITPTKLAEAVGISVPYASQLLSDDPAKRRIPSMEMAIKVFRATGLRLSPITDATLDEIATLERFQGAA
jgi:transcriptional regulator with XRE-family HTH domain